MRTSGGAIVDDVYSSKLTYKTDPVAVQLQLFCLQAAMRSGAQCWGWEAFTILSAHRRRGI
jgi:hypothetical protein